MSQGFMSKIKNWVSGDPFEEDVYSFEDDFEQEPRLYRATASNPRPERHELEPSALEAKKRRPNLKLIDQPNTQATQVVVIEPKAFEEALEIIEHLRAKKSVILNLHLLDTNQSQRVVDFLSGATHAIDGNQQRIGDGVFMFTPNNVVITTPDVHAVIKEAPIPSASSSLAGALGDTFWSNPH
ncbi:MAG: cell division protein SepF [Cyanobacteria bacterium]|nr:cell division protein SepF [Cyanobacteriota bacterium]